MLRLVALVLPLSLDTFAMAAAVGLQRLPARDRLRLGLLFALFEGGMPLVGLLAGAQLGRLLGSVADLVAIAALVVLGVVLLVRRQEGEADGEEERAGRLASAGGLAAVTLGLSVSLDELAIGFVLGLARVPLLPAVVLIAVQAFAAAQLGFALGARIGERLREVAERAAGFSLLLLAAGLAAARLAGVSV